MEPIFRPAMVRPLARWLALALVLWCATGSAATFTVDNLSDNFDTAPGDGTCNVGDGTCSFRAAVQEANALAGADRLELIAGTHQLTIQNGAFGLLKPSLESAIEVVGAGIGQTVIYSQSSASSGVIDVLSQPAQVTISNLTIDNRTGGVSLVYFGIGHSVSFPTGLLLEDAELLSNSTVPALCCGAAEVIDGAGSGQVILRRSQVQAQRVSANGFLINARHRGGLIIEDSILDGGNQYRIAVLQNLTTSSSGPVTVSGSTFRNFGGPPALFGAADAVIYMRPFNVPGQTTIERSNFESSYQALNVVNSGFNAQVTITDSLFNGLSTAVRAGGPATVTLDNSTVSGGGTGLAIVAPASGTGLVDMALANSTVTGATTNLSVSDSHGTLTAHNSIIANGGTDCVGTLTSAGHNLVEGTCTIAGDTTGNITGQDPMLDALSDNGGPTLTHALMAGSPAVDAGDDGSCLATDQRGFARPADGDGNMTATCDMGAFEKDAVLVGNPPDAVDDSFDILEDTTSLGMNVISNDIDGDGVIDPSSTNTDCGACSEPATGSLTNNGDGTFTYFPLADFFGEVSFVYEVCDDLAECDTATVTITIDPINDAPDFQGGPDQDFPGGTAGMQAIANWATGFDPGPMEDAQTIDDYLVTIDSDPAAILNSADVSNIGTLNLDLSGNAGTAAVSVRVRDDGGTANGGQDTSPAQGLVVTVQASNTAPVAADDAYTVLEDGAVVADDADGSATAGNPADDGVVANDSDPEMDPLSVTTAGTFSAAGIGGTVVLSADGTFSYTPPPDTSGVASFDYTLSDGSLTDTATVSFVVDPVNDAPGFQAGLDQSFPGGTAGVQAIANWATGFDPGPMEGAQGIDDYLVTIDSDPAAILNGVDVSNIGTLNLDLSGNAGTAAVSVRVRDDGGTANGGQDTSPAQGLFVTVGTNANISVAMTQCNPSSAPGFEHSYLARVSNQGPDPANGIALEVSLPMDTSFVDSNPGAPDCIESGGLVSCAVGGLAPLQTRDFTIGFLLEAGANGTLIGDAMVVAVEPDPAPGDNLAMITTEVVDDLVRIDGFESCGSF